MTAPGAREPDPPLERVVLHVGLYKTGTTYLQNLLRENRRSLRRAGVYLPPRKREVTFAALDLVDRQFRGVNDARVPGAWDRLAAEVNACGLPTAIVSEERLSVATPRQVRRAVGSFGSARVHVVVTVRDLSRVLVSHWQEEVKNGSTWSLLRYADALRDPQAAGVHPARGFWMHEDVTAVLRAWSSAVPVERIHVVTVPPAGSPPGVLAERFASVAGFEPGDVSREGVWTNENVGAVGTELLRRLNERVTDRMHGIEHERGIKIPLARALAAMPGKGSVDVPATHREWAGRTAGGFVEEIRAGGYDVVGDLDDLTPTTSVADEPAVGTAGADTRGTGGNPPAPAGTTARTTTQATAVATAPDAADDRHDDAALLEAALEALAALALRQGRVLAAADRLAAAERDDLAGRRTRVLTWARHLSFRSQRAAADLAGRTRLGRRLTAATLRRRAGR